MITLNRSEEQDNDGEKGTMELGGFLWHTLEQNWRDNKPFESCLPKGDYALEPYTSEKYGECFIAVNEELNVYYSKDSEGRPEDGRYACIFFHKGNYVGNFVGCGGVGFGYNAKLNMITNTTKACLKVNKLIEEEGSYHLRIS